MNRNPISILLSVFVLAVVGLSLISVPVAASGVGVWTSTTSYPTNIAEGNCVFHGGYIYCVGGYTTTGGVGYTSAAHFAPLSATGAGVWKSTTSYPTKLWYPSCAASTDGYIYCVGGYDGSVYTSAVYFASLHSSGISAWTATTSYPTTIREQSCFVSNGYIYCVGGYTGSVYEDDVYFAPVSGTGVGTWTETTSYPTNIADQSCVISTGGVFCVAGYTGTAVTGAVYFAPYTPSGVGAWTATTSYPTTIFAQDCAVRNGVIYCVGGKTGGGAYTSTVYFASTSVSGVGAWTSTTHNYPTTIYEQGSCVFRGPQLFCVGGYTGSVYTSAVYFASVS